VEEGSYEGYEPSATFRELATINLRRRRIAIANIIRSRRRINGKELSNVAIASKVRGSTPSEVRDVREELAQFGVLKDEIEALPNNEGGDQ
jgi:hypothetical protein